MIDIEIDVSQVLADASAADDVLDREIQDAVARALDAGAQEAIDTHRFKNRTGDLERSLRGRLTGHHEGTFESTVQYASYVDRGRFNDQFMARAERRAAAVLERETEAAARVASDVLNRSR